VGTAEEEVARHRVDHRVNRRQGAADRGGPDKKKIENWPADTFPSAFGLLARHGSLALGGRKPRVGQKHRSVKKVAAGGDVGLRRLYLARAKSLNDSHRGGINSDQSRRSQTAKTNPEIEKRGRRTNSSIPMLQKKKKKHRRELRSLQPSLLQSRRARDGDRLHVRAEVENVEKNRRILRLRNATVRLTKCPKKVNDRGWLRSAG